MRLLISVLLLSTLSYDSLERGWKGIKPLRTDKVTIDKLLGKSTVDDNGYVSYRFERGAIQINYSTAPCQENRYKRGQFNVPENTVLDYIVYLHKPIDVSELQFEKGRYYRDTIGHIEGLVSYRSAEQGVTIDAEMIGGKEYAGRISFRPTTADAKKYACSK